MLSRQGIFKVLSLLLVVSLFLVACERPLQSVGDGEEETPTATTDESEEAPSGEEAGEVSGDGGAVGTEEEPTPAPTEEEPTAAPTDTPEATAEGEDESPRTDDESRDEEDEEAAEEDQQETVDEEAEAQETEEAAEETTEEEESAATEETTGVRTHVVQAGENLYRIGLQYGISWVVLAQYNNLPNANAIYAGQELRIPPSEEQAGTPTPAPTPETETTYVVQPGDNLYRIGRRFGVNWVEIAEANGIVNPNRILVGQELTIPGAASAPDSEVTHTVQGGETLFSISLSYGVTWTDIAEANDLTSPYVIYPGQSLVIPGG